MIGQEETLHFPHREGGHACLCFFWAAFTWDELAADFVDCSKNKAAWSIDFLREDNTNVHSHCRCLKLTRLICRRRSYVCFCVILPVCLQRRRLIRFCFLEPFKQWNSCDIRVMLSGIAALAPGRIRTIRFCFAFACRIMQLSSHICSCP